MIQRLFNFIFKLLSAVRCYGIVQTGPRTVIYLYRLRMSLYSTRRLCFLVFLYLCYDPPSPTGRKGVAAAAAFSGYQKRPDDARFEWAVSATAATAAVVAATAAGAPSRQSNGSAERYALFACGAAHLVHSGLSIRTIFAPYRVLLLFSLFFYSLSIYYTIPNHNK